MTRVFNQINGILWGAPALLLILTVGLFLSLRLHFVQLRLLPRALGQLGRSLRRKDGRSEFQALCTALAATVGTGNLAGVAGAICLGGPGAVFWMWLCGILGMVTKYAEAVLAVRYRVKTEAGYKGGPMYVMELGLGSRWKPMAMAYCLFGLLASFGIGNGVQIRTVLSGINMVQSRFGMAVSRQGNLLLGVLLAILIGRLLLGGARRIGEAAQLLVPIAAAGYILLCLGVLILRAEAIPRAFASILQGAFSPRAVTGGILGSSFQALRIGCSRGVFTNEAGMGTAAIAHGSAEVSHPAQQGLMGIVEVFLDTIVICTLTALVILTSGAPVPYGSEAGVELTTWAFSQIYGSFASVFLALALCLFAVATVLGWGLYGARCACYFFGRDVWKAYALAQTAMVVVASTMDAASLWQFSEMLNGLMVIPNLITLAALSSEVVRLTKDYEKTGS
ncbi:MAG: sodium:alanine symporter family protein [Oscillospiraceae bacterium]|nr:sodium:alanine symporter family protein [Oscillospiraceae bacterium]